MEFTIGQIIYHETLGEGEITNITERKQNGITYLPIVEVKFENSTREFTTQSLAEHLLPEDILE